MKKFRYWSIPAVLLAVIIASLASMAQIAKNKIEPQYQTLSPWAEVDPIPLKGIAAPRLDNLTGKKIGLFVNYKRAAQPSAEAVEKQMKSRYPDAEFSYYVSTDWNVNVVETKDRDKFEAWVKSVDAIIATIGD